jgi:transcriptional regulator with XRE-family HTH domain
VAGTAIRYYRERLGLKQAQLAEKLGLDTAVMSKLESGLQIPTSEQVDRIAELLQTTPSLLWSRHILAEVADRARQGAA